MQIDELNFLDYLGKEEYNLLASLMNFRSDFDLFHDIDNIYREPLRRLQVSENEAVVPQLYLFVHFHLYFSISTILRSHLSECLGSTRKAIDASLSAYKIILEPSYNTKYVKRDNYFQHIKSNLKSEIKQDHSKYPLAHNLITLHGLCSQFGSHADITSFFHRLEIKKSSEVKNKELLVYYFQFPKNPIEYRFYYIVTLQSFYLMFLIFKAFFDKTFKIIDAEWENKIKELGPKLDNLRKNLHSNIKHK